MIAIQERVGGEMDDATTSQVGTEHSRAIGVEIERLAARAMSQRENRPSFLAASRQPYQVEFHAVFG